MRVVVASALLLNGCANEVPITFRSGLPHQGTSTFTCAVRWQGPRQVEVQVEQVRTSCRTRVVQRDYAGVVLRVSTRQGENLHREIFGVVLDEQARDLPWSQPFALNGCSGELILELFATCDDGRNAVGSAACQVELPDCQTVES